VLHRAGLLDQTELDAMLEALSAVSSEVESGQLVARDDEEDVHAVLERALLEKLGPLGGKLRAGRSRNDQIATDLRLFCRDHARGLAADVVDLIEALTQRAAEHADTPAPGMTHLQHAQPVTFGHQLLAHTEALSRDLERLRDWDERA